MIFIYLLSGLYLGWSLGANDTGNIFGAAVETRMLKFKRAALIAAIFITLGAVLEGSGPSRTLGRLGSVDALGGAFTVALAAAVVITVMVKIRIPVSTSQTIVGAIIGWNYFAGRLTDFKPLITIAGSWVIAFVLSGVISGALFFLLRRILDRAKLHLLKLDLYTRYGLIVVGAFAAYSLGANNIANVVGVFVPVSPFKDISLGSGFVLSGISQLYLLGAISIAVGIYTYSHKVMRTVGKDLFRLSPVTALIAVMAEAIVLFLFASQGLYHLLLKLGLPTIPLVPVSSSQVIVGAVVGIGIVKGGKNIRYNVLGKISMAWVLAPVMAFLISFVALFIVQNVFEQRVHQELTYSFNSVTVPEMERNGLDVNKLPFIKVNYYSERQIYHELNNTGGFSREEILKIVRIAEVYPLQVDIQKLYSGRMINRFEANQVNDLISLTGAAFYHKWQLQGALQSYEGWQLISNPKGEAEKQHNRDLLNQMELLYRAFYRNGKELGSSLRGSEGKVSQGGGE
ncbi:MAG: anion permease [Candidatus Cloacimonetes bacterium]|nr:anion permease [Candidatus Cloacimonadota bacterium]